MIRNTATLGQSPKNALKEAIDASSISGIPLLKKSLSSQKPLMKKDDGENIGPLDSITLSSKSVSGGSSVLPNPKVNMNKTTT